MKKRYILVLAIFQLVLFTHIVYSELPIPPPVPVNGDDESAAPPDDFTDDDSGSGTQVSESPYNASIEEPGINDSAGDRATPDISTQSSDSPLNQENNEDDTGNQLQSVIQGQNALISDFQNKINDFEERLENGGVQDNSSLLIVLIVLVFILIIVVSVFLVILYKKKASNERSYKYNNFNRDAITGNRIGEHDLVKHPQIKTTNRRVEAVVRYLRENIRKGYSIDILKHYLSSNGYSISEVNEALLRLR
ncbi:MAG: hypothetical protein KAK00_05805 [Nanoarchaeota archaeon]|nr:hypothetical protein [Nanoarchaeota archaeon]